MCVPCFIMAKSYMRAPSLDIADNYMLMFRYGLQLYLHAMFFLLL